MTKVTKPHVLQTCFGTGYLVVCTFISVLHYVIAFLLETFIHPSHCILVYQFVHYLMLSWFWDWLLYKLECVLMHNHHLFTVLITSIGMTCMSFSALKMICLSSSPGDYSACQCLHRLVWFHQVQAGVSYLADVCPCASVDIDTT